MATCLSSKLIKNGILSISPEADPKTKVEKLYFTFIPRVIWENAQICHAGVIQERLTHLIVGRIVHQSFCQIRQKMTTRLKLSKNTGMTIGFSGRKIWINKTWLSVNDFFREWVPRSIVTQVTFREYLMIDIGSMDVYISILPHHIQQKRRS